MEGIISIERQVRPIGDLDDSDSAKLERLAERALVAARPRPLYSTARAHRVFT